MLTTKEIIQVMGYPLDRQEMGRRQAAINHLICNNTIDENSRGQAYGAQNLCRGRSIPALNAYLSNDCVLNPPTTFQLHLNLRKQSSFIVGVSKSFPNTSQKHSLISTRAGRSAFPEDSL